MDDFSFLHDSYNNKTEHLTQGLPEILLVEDDEILGKTIKKFLEKKLHTKVNYFSAPSECLGHLEESQLGKYCLITDISFEDTSVDGLTLIDMLKERDDRFVSIVITGFASIETAINATKKGVFQYLTKPFELDVLGSLVIDAFAELGVNKDIFCEKRSGKRPSVFFHRFKVAPHRDEDMFYGMIGNSAVMREMFESIRKISESNSTVLITGASGTGKELVAKAIHSMASRCSKRMVAVNCGAIPSDLLESELFGHIRGSFTGAISNRKGRFELANEGTIFLDEIGDMSLHLQVKLLRVLQSREIEPVGSSVSQEIDVRVITATHRDLDKAVLDGSFREDLFYRLNVIPIRVPSLSERREDIPQLISYFLTRFTSADGRNKIEFSEDALELLISHDWPGNVRELENLIERLVILKGGSLVTADDLPAKFLTRRGLARGASRLVSLPEDGINLKTMLSEIEDELIFQALEKTSGNKNQASKLLQMNRTTLIEKMKKKGLIEQKMSKRHHFS